MKTRLKEKYLKEVFPIFSQRYGVKNSLAAPRLTKVTINMGVGVAAQNPKELEEALADLTLISGQKPVATLAKKSIAGFKIRKGLAIGCKVTLRKDRMYEFLDKLFNVVLPRVRDFRGLSLQSFDRQGNYTLGIREQNIFPEIDTAKLGKTRSLEITIGTSAKKPELAQELLRLLGMSLRSD
ncbi:50S ribosomal protein L5 [candidate division WWE3 bacterium CG06_land_8_20_14_3_00_42_16]|uniref:Large ribosomal subunit protein uL5 n=4 Tax=Katanobacteria TaxID=422282 RepID=A0A2M7AN15_UNCKA|nr:MAG: 50S ribosomal protein L5 [bacterium CG1_02_42_9]PIU68650.1 MAG: 50S ribosomal protein L5 [candidate division WWE3 bacterium CG06_land_8_20_14_3_00_42_16]PIZ42995.1 MAG: 50S ribosomal protein L5 [candidate division WWE3 bacterium CG_4_10_14_0_2_um_filter_42_8]PJA37993.1 MAG: 50S ribosomal protein L5 [candidate division WWE3 bacterium CG_4_9_14_3_um_filter_43_9]PJC69371.1 MAG: 50S ribosomal protein L5 [candidate division WWE3 bacterium CG_4_8_14_3_um_filter_42_11]